MTEYVKAQQKDFIEVVDLLNHVFSTSYRPHDFEAFLPGLYSEKNFMTGANYIAREDGKIVANVGAYPATYSVCGQQFKVSGITSVAVHPRARSKGHMRKLMDMALDDMKNDGVALSFLMGQKQRYEYFGYTACGSVLNYTCTGTNIRHHFNGDFDSELVLKEITNENITVFEEIFQRHHSMNVHMLRLKERFCDIMANWEHRTIGVYQNDALIGYFSAEKDYSSIYELNINDPGLLAEILGMHLKQYQKDSVNITVYSSETALINQLSGFAESVTMRSALSFNVLNYTEVLNAFLKLKSEITVLPDGELTVNIKDKCNITIAASNNCPLVTVTDKTPDVECTHVEAMQLFFSPISAYTLGALDRNTFARGLFPIPLFVMSNDQS